MKKFFIFLMISFISFGFVTDLQAKRFGGGRSFGATRASNVFSAARSPQIPRPMSNSRKWLAPIFGFALGGILASLLMGNGFGSGLFTWAILLGAIYLITQFIRRRSQPAFSPNQYQYQSNQDTIHNQQRNQPLNFSSLSSSQPTFNSQEFLRNAKATFIRLQAAYDSKNLADLFEFTTPEVFSEIQLQLQERGDVKNITEVISLQAEMDYESSSSVTVRFSGMIKEEQDQPAEPFNEIWNFNWDPSVNSWKVAGIQQEITGKIID